MALSTSLWAPGKLNNRLLRARGPDLRAGPYSGCSSGGEKAVRPALLLIRGGLWRGWGGGWGVCIFDSECDARTREGRAGGEGFRGGGGRWDVGGIFVPCSPSGIA